MSIFTRFKDIVESNINAMLDKAENPQRMLRLMIQDMEDTLVEMKVSCAQIMAERARLRRSVLRIREDMDNWQNRAELALSKNREDLAREALIRKREIKDESGRMEAELQNIEESISRQQNEIELIEGKLCEAREKLRDLSTEPKPPAPKTETKPQSPPPKSADETDKTKKVAELEKLQRDEEIEKELTELKTKLNPTNK
jgi:phage shock protein A